ncbi:MAG: metal-dependent hydrolase [Planctomycetes bacterium]|nr:metal-dependent hydrolase [Planctomycetota bacterium]
MALASAGADRLSPLATLGVVLGANLPDLDVLGFPFGGRPYYLCHHRGLTHALPGLALESLLLAGAIFGIARLMRRGGEPLRFRGLWLAAAIGLLSHLLLDSLNTYGVRPFLPFSDARFYGDLAFIVDPWLWLGFGFAACLGAPGPRPLAPSAAPRGADVLEDVLSKASAGDLAGAEEAAGVALGEEEAPAAELRGRVCEGLARVGWGAAFFLALGVLFSTDRAPRAVAWLWGTAFLAILIVRHFGFVPNRARQRFAWAGLVAVAVYLVVLGAFQRAGDASARAAVAQKTEAPILLSTTHPAPAIPWRFSALVATQEEVYSVSVDLFEPRIWVDPDPLPRRLDHPGLRRVEGTREHVAWKSFARIPFVSELRPRPGEDLRLLLGDARYLPRPVEGWCNLAVTPLPGR